MQPATGLSTGHLSHVETFRADRESSLRKEYGWLSLAGLFWLQEGENAFGSEAENLIRLPERAPSHLGTLELVDGVVFINPAGQDDQLRFGETTLVRRQPLLPDNSGTPDYLFADDIRIGVIERSGQFAIRVWDPQNPVRLNFPGCIWYEPRSEWRIQAKIESFADPKTILIDDIVGIQRPTEMHAALAFDVEGVTYRLDAERLNDDSFNLIFKDKTAGVSTYLAGRYLITEPAEGDRVVMDFNVAYNPPCAFTLFATCPLPPAQNVLPISIEAGEKFETL